jgi:hypothetical protein
MIGASAHKRRDESVPRAVASGAFANGRSLPLAVLIQPTPCEIQILTRRAYRPRRAATPFAQPLREVTGRSPLDYILLYHLPFLSSPIPWIQGIQDAQK